MLPLIHYRNFAIAALSGGIMKKKKYMRYIFDDKRYKDEGCKYGLGFFSPVSISLKKIIEIAEKEFPKIPLTDLVVRSKSHSSDFEVCLEQR